MDEGKGTAFIILGIVAIIAIVGLVLLLTGNQGTTGKIATLCSDPAALVLAPPTDNPWLLDQYRTAGYTCEKALGADVYGKETWCCKTPANVPVRQRATTTPVGYD